MNITLHQLRILSAIARLNNFTRAAEELHISQPAVSMQIKQLEEMLGAPVTEHVNKRIHLTSTGQTIFEAARDILSRLDRLEGDLQELKGEISGPLDIAVVTSAKHFLPHYLGEFMRQHPKIKPRLTVTNRATVLEAISENRHDLYIMGQVPAGLDIEAHPFLDNIIEVIAAPNHPLSKKKKISLKMLAEEPFLVREQGSGTRVAVDRMFAERALSIKPFMELGSSGAIKNAVIAGLGLAVLSRHSLEYELKSKAIQILDVENFPLHRRWYAAYPGGKRLSFSARTFLEFLMNSTKEGKK
jgi:LysR family transcriptional regulator, low CO2-responsive transcriptional regulator